MTSPPLRTGRPHFTGITTYADPDGRFEFRHPSDWGRSELDDDRDGIIVSPDQGEETTYFAVDVTDLGTGVVADDLDDLRRGFDAGIASLSGVVVEHSKDDLYNDIVKLERTYTFDDEGTTRRRRTWAMYADHWQFLVVYQGATPAEYAYWLPMGNYCFTAFQLPMALWFATDRSVLDELRPPS